MQESADGPLSRVLGSQRRIRSIHAAQNVGKPVGGRGARWAAQLGRCQHAGHVPPTCCAAGCPVLHPTQHKCVDKDSPGIPVPSVAMQASGYLLLLPGNKGLCAPPPPPASADAIDNPPFVPDISACWRDSGVGGEAADSGDAMLDDECLQIAADLPLCRALPGKQLALSTVLAAVAAAVTAAVARNWASAKRRRLGPRRLAAALYAWSAGLSSGAANGILGSWRLQSTSLQLRRRDLEFVRREDGAFGVLGRGATATVSGRPASCRHLVGIPPLSAAVLLVLVN